MISPLRIARQLEVLLLCLLALQQANIANAQGCADDASIPRTTNDDYVTDDEGCYQDRCEAVGCSFGCIDSRGVCDSHAGEYSPSDWNGWGMDGACECDRDAMTGRTTCSRVPCGAADNTCSLSYNGYCNEHGGGCDLFTDCSDCGNCGESYNDCDEECEEAIAAIIGFLAVVCIIAFLGVGGGIYCCISSKSKTLGSRPSGMAWLASLIICIFVSPLCMWIPFVCDSCYEPTNRLPNVVITQTQQSMMPVVAQAQPMMAQAQGQPTMAVAQAQPMMAQAQAQPMAVAQAQ
jgi:hypothetical protein